MRNAIATRPVCAPLALQDHPAKLVLTENRGLMARMEHREKPPNHLHPRQNHLWGFAPSAPSGQQARQGREALKARLDHKVNLGQKEPMGKMALQVQMGLPGMQDLVLKMEKLVQLVHRASQGPLVPKDQWGREEIWEDLDKLDPREIREPTGKMVCQGLLGLQGHLEPMVHLEIRAPMGHLGPQESLERTPSTVLVPHVVEVLRLLVVPPLLLPQHLPLLLRKSP